MLGKKKEKKKFFQKICIIRGLPGEKRKKLTKNSTKISKLAIIKSLEHSGSSYWYQNFCYACLALNKLIKRTNTTI